MIQPTVRAATSIAEAIFARDGKSPSPDRLAWVGQELSDFLARAGARTRVLLSAMIWLVSLLGPLFIGRLALLGALTLDVRIVALDRLERNFGAPLLAVKALLCLVYYEHPDSARDAGVDGACLLPRAPSTESGTGRS